MSRKDAAFCSCLLLALLISGCGEQQHEKVSESPKVPVDKEEAMIEVEPMTFDCGEETGTPTNGDVKLIAMLTMAEAEDECELGKRLVIDTVLNRVDSENFPGTIDDVIFEPGQFPPMANGRAEMCYADEDICILVREEIENRTNSECVYFQTDCYPSWGKPLFVVQNHYFSGEEDESE